MNTSIEELTTFVDFKSTPIGSIKCVAELLGY
jgi:hypothetical protein